MFLNHVNILDPFGEHPFLPDACIEIVNGKIKTVLRDSQDHGGAECTDMDGQYVLPGMINAHTHLYSTLALGMPAPPEAPKNFTEILKSVWWPLDRSLDRNMLEASFKAGLLDCLRWGCTTVYDHHSSPFATEGVLENLAGIARDLGIRVATAFEVSDRDGEKVFDDQLRANLRCFDGLPSDSTSKAFLGLHASFTLADESLERVAEVLHSRPGLGIHIHASEDVADEADARNRGYGSVVQRLDTFGLLNEKAILAHGLHILERDVGILLDRKVTLVHNPSSNANNQVGILAADTLARLNAGLGTDGMQNNMLAEAREGTLIRSAAKMGGANYPAMLFRNNPLMASAHFNGPLGHTAAGNPADLVFYDYDPRTDIHADNLTGHLLWGLSQPSGVMTNGEFRRRDHRWVQADAAAIHENARHQSSRLWASMESKRM